MAKPFSWGEKFWLLLGGGAIVIGLSGIGLNLWVLAQREESRIAARKASTAPGQYEVCISRDDFYGCETASCVIAKLELRASQ